LFLLFKYFHPQAKGIFNYLQKISYLWLCRCNIFSLLLEILYRLLLFFMIIITKYATAPNYTPIPTTKYIFKILKAAIFFIIESRYNLFTNLFNLLWAFCKLTNALIDLSYGKVINTLINYSLNVPEFSIGLFKLFALNKFKLVLKL